jgi:hypothetical protein
LWFWLWFRLLLSWYFDCGVPDRTVEGEDRAGHMNRQELFRQARRTSQPVLSSRAFHLWNSSDGHTATENLPSDDFRGLEASLLLCVGARVLLTHNLWPESGLMNGAFGWLRGFVWVDGGDPHSADTKQQAPICLIIEFDDVDLGVDATTSQPRRFFPDMDLGNDDSGKPRSRRFVPIFRQSHAGQEYSTVTRSQFPVVLAWALTHWKAQGMNLANVRVVP